MQYIQYKTNAIYRYSILIQNKTNQNDPETR